MSPPMIHKNKKPLHDALVFRKERSDITMNIVLQWYVDGYSDTMLGYVNGTPTNNGGAHIDAVKASLTRTLNNLAKKSKFFKDEDITLSDEHVREGLTCIVSVCVPQPEFEGQLHKTRLVNPFVREIVDKSLEEYLTEYFKVHPNVFESIISKSLNAYKTSLAFKKAMELSRSKSTVSMPSSSIREKPNNFSSVKSEMCIGRGESSGSAKNNDPNRHIQRKRTREQQPPMTDGVVSRALGNSLDNTSSDSSTEKKAKKLKSCDASNPLSRKEVSVKTFKNLVPCSKKDRKFIPIGPGFQAELPVWIAPTKKGKFYGSPGDSDTLKWLGTGVWPTYSRKKMVYCKKVGEGRPDSCSCASPRSTTCTRQHIKEARELLKNELNRGFYTWKFDDMGENGSESWTTKEEEKFEALLKKNPLPISEGFWKLASIAFPSKSEKDLHSYYYNVFLIKRARLVAKSSPGDIDSDDDH